MSEKDHTRGELLYRGTKTKITSDFATEAAEARKKVSEEFCRGISSKLRELTLQK